jgi:S1-C subfamily serine protease
MSSLGVVLVLLLLVRWVLPPLLESSRYSWYRGQLRAEYESAGEQLRNVSLDGLSRVSELVSQRVTPCVVHVNVKQSIGAEVWSREKIELDGEAFDSFQSDGQGSGVIVDSEGYILTNYHVLAGGEQIDVRFSDDSRREARIIGIDQARDIAVLKVEDIELPAVAWGNSDTTTVGSPVWAVGSPFGLHGSITFGILSSKHRADLSDSHYQRSKVIKPQYSDLMQSDVAVNPGNSGGPLVNGQGELIGINTAILGEWYRGVSFSIPSNLARQIYEEIREKSKTPRGWLGVKLQGTDEEIEPPAMHGVRVVGFAGFEHSPARRGRMKVSDVIISFNDQPIEKPAQLIALIGQTAAGSKATIEVVRDGSRQRLELELGSRHVELDVAP